MKEETESDRAACPTLIALCKQCGSIIACAVVSPERARENAKHVASWVRHGLTVKTISVSEVRTGSWCNCPRKSRKRKVHKEVA